METSMLSDLFLGNAKAGDRQVLITEVTRVRIS
jgi:hypothetical protein